jgi:hypothetical protein
MASVAIGTTAVSLAGTAASAGMQMSAADRAARAQGAAGKKYNKQLSQATNTFNKQQSKLRKQIQKIDPTIQIPEYNLQNATADAIELANRATANTLEQLEKVAPGSAQARQQVGNIIGSYLRGEIPQDVQQQTMRSIAEFGGAGFNPATAGRAGGFQAAQGLVPRQFGETSMGLKRLGMEYNWRNTAQAFNMMARPETYMAFGLQGRGQDINIAQANIANRMAQAEMIGGINLGQYNAMTGQAQAGYGVAQEGISANLAARQAAAQGIGDVTGTVGQLGLAGYMAYNQLDAAKGAEMASGALSNKTLYATPQMSQQYNYGTMPSMSDRPVAIPQSRYI